MRGWALDLSRANFVSVRCVGLSYHAFKRRMRPAGRSLAISTLGAALGLLTFLQSTIFVLMRGSADALPCYTPEGFWRWLFVPSYLLMACGVGMAVEQYSTASKCIADTNCKRERK